MVLLPLLLKIEHDFLVPARKMRKEGLKRTIFQPGYSLCMYVCIPRIEIDEGTTPFQAANQPQANPTLNNPTRHNKICFRFASFCFVVLRLTLALRPVPKMNIKAKANSTAKTKATFDQVRTWEALRSPGGGLAS